MNMTFWIEVLKFSIATLGSTAIVVAILSFLSKTFISHWFKKDYEKFKTSLTHTLQQDIFRFAKMHERRADVTEEIYKKLFFVNKYFTSLMRPLQMAGEEREEEKAKKAVEAANELFDYFGEHKIYFNKSTVSKMDAINKKYIEIWEEWMSKKDAQMVGDPYSNIWRKLWEKINKELPSLQEELENEFRLMIGSND